MATVTITPTEVPPPTTCADCGKEPGVYDVAIFSASYPERYDETVMVAVCLTCIANLSGQLGGAAFALTARDAAL